MKRITWNEYRDSHLTSPGEISKVINLKIRPEEAASIKGMMEAQSVKSEDPDLEEIVQEVQRQFVIRVLSDDHRFRAYPWVSLEIGEVYVMLSDIFNEYANTDSEVYKMCRDVAYEFGRKVLSLF